MVDVVLYCFECESFDLEIKQSNTTFKIILNCLNCGCVFNSDKPIRWDLLKNNSKKWFLKIEIIFSLVEAATFVGK